MNVTDGREEATRHSSYDFDIQSTQWSQVTPEYMPWGHTPTSPAAPLVTFTATSSQSTQQQQPGPSGLHYNPNLVSHCKRKAELDIAA